MKILVLWGGVGVGRMLMDLFVLLPRRKWGG
jgi:predicted ATPase